MKNGNRSFFTRTGSKCGFLLCFNIGTVRLKGSIQLNIVKERGIFLNRFDGFGSFL